MAIPGVVLGIDPGLAATGFGIVDEREQVVVCGSIRTDPGPAGPRLLELVRRLGEVIAPYPLREAALEELFMGRNRTSAIAVAHARGAIMALLEGVGIRSYEYKPAQVKSVVTGYGMADKAQMARMVAAQVRGLDASRDNHAVDAVAIALCHCRSRRALGAAR